MINKKKRSPKYPSLDLERAIGMTGKILDAYAKSPVDRESAFKAMGYSGLSGTSAPALGSLVLFGLVEYVRKGEVCVTDLATKVIWGESSEERKIALREAALKPQAFKKLWDRFSQITQTTQTDAPINYLRTENYSKQAAEVIVKNYLSTVRFCGLNRDNVRFDSASKNAENLYQSDAETPLSEFVHKEEKAQMRSPNVYEFQDWARFRVGRDDGVVRIQTLNGHDMNRMELEDVRDVIDRRLNRLDSLNEPNKEE